MGINLPSPSLQAMRAFRAVVELQSFKRAGTQLGIGGSAVSKLVAGLEQDLGVSLLQRTTRTQALTEAGAGFYEAVVRVLDDTDAAIDRLREVGAQPQGLLRVSVPTSFALCWLAQRLPDFLVRYPALRVDMALNDRIVDLVAERFDCALRIGAGLPDSSLYARRLGSIPRVLVAAPRYLRHAPVLTTPADLQSHECLVYSLASTGNTWPFMVAGEALNVEVTGRLTVDNSVAMRDCLLAGLGLMLTPHFVVADLLSAGKVLALLDQFDTPPLGVFGVFTQRRHLPLKTRVFLDFVEGALRDSGYGDAAK